MQLQKDLAFLAGWVILKVSITMWKRQGVGECARDRRAAEKLGPELSAAGV
jgi:hypothetical protein